MIDRILDDLTPQQIAIVIGVGTFASLILAILLAWAFRKWNVRRA